MLPLKTYSLLDYERYLSIIEENTQYKRERVLVCQHPPVITVGRAAGFSKTGRVFLPLKQPEKAIGGNPKEELRTILRPNGPASEGPPPVFAIDRGGLATAHEPGQLVIYPQVFLAARGLKLGDFIAGLQELICRFLNGLSGRKQFQRLAGKPGIYQVHPHRPAPHWPKIASLGLGVKKGLTRHGLAINISNQLKVFDHIFACGETRPVMNLLDARFAPGAREKLAAILAKPGGHEILGILLARDIRHWIYRHGRSRPDTRPGGASYDNGKIHQ